MLVKGNPFSWNQPGISVNANYDASAVTFSTDAAGSSAATFPYGGTMATSNQSLTIYSQGTIVYTAPPSLNFVTMNWTSISITDNTSAGYNLSPAQMALAYINTKPFLTSNIIGATNLDQLKENIESIDINLDEKIIEKIEGIHKENPNPCP